MDNECSFQVISDLREKLIQGDPNKNYKGYRHFETVNYENIDVPLVFTNYYIKNFRIKMSNPTTTVYRFNFTFAQAFNLLSNFY